jgi:hypothetical protein
LLEALGIVCGRVEKELVDVVVFRESVVANVVVVVTIVVVIKGVVVTAEGTTMGVVTAGGTTLGVVTAGGMTRGTVVVGSGAGMRGAVVGATRGRVVVVGRTTGSGTVAIGWIQGAPVVFLLFFLFLEERMRERKEGEGLEQRQQTKRK